eukprot:CAMPEP_0201484058 /NCGR_PEP_ID=MMETSP0151_2-20130828/8248_1 /ASSEMBLY_ACC=CAM_ASM_000257 /TAXON_ID=200890 /ORGANISM="Paramoeba atlantica, Strain 621/1 / CCAP 1560/9" /LENGTH=131 /DNA_ID=CAMNT_0047867515 /DNA_START=62 /DNA_END=453 /DNA_ORIENTATION=+
MAQLVARLEPQSMINMKNETQACTWAGVTCNSADEVTSISWKSRGLKGNLTWGSLPHTVCTLCVSQNGLGGTVPVHLFPPKLSHLYIQNNIFFGPFDTISLPHALVEIWSSGTKFSGVLDLTLLPPLLKML